MRHSNRPHHTVTRGAFETFGIPIDDTLGRATLCLVRTGSGKWHIPGCQHAPAREGEQVALLGLNWANVCRLCGAADTVAPEHQAVLAAVQTLIEMRAATEEFADFLASTDDRWSWLDYARHRASCPLTTPAALADPLRGRRGWAGTAAAVTRAGMELSNRYAELLDELADRLGDHVEDGLLDRAVAAVATESSVKKQSARLQRITHAAYRPSAYSEPKVFDPWTFAADTWLHAHRRGRDRDAAAAVRAGLARYMPQVRDLTALPHNPAVPAVPAVPDDSPHSWADRVLARLRDDIADTWTTRLDTALTRLRADRDSDIGAAPDHALLVRGWPLVGEDQLRLAYLAQYPSIIDPVRLRTNTYDPDITEYCDTLIVLRVPDAAARQAHAVAGIAHSCPLNDGLDQQAAALALLHNAGLVLHPLDMPPLPAPSMLVQAERARLDAALVTEGHHLTRPFAVGALPPTNTDNKTEWTEWSAFKAFDRLALFIPGFDDPALLALGFPTHRGAYGPVAVWARVEVRPRSHPNHTTRTPYDFPPEITRPPTETNPGLIDIEAVLHSADRTTLLLEVTTCPDQIVVPLDRVALLHPAR